MIADTDSISTTMPQPNGDTPSSAKAKFKATLQTQFTEFDLLPQVQRAIAQQGYSTATQIQAMSILPVLEGTDVVGQAETGTGKTAAFALPLLSRLDLSDRRPQILVLSNLLVQDAEQPRADMGPPLVPPQLEMEKAFRR